MIHPPQPSFQRPFAFNGRIRRTEYGLSLLLYAVFWFAYVTVGFNILFAIFDGHGNNTRAIVALITCCVWVTAVWFMMAQGAKRCHDLGRSGWWQFLPFYFLWMLFQDGQPGVNDYGVNPKGVADPMEEFLLEQEPADGTL